ncbi:MAG: CarD family transcriptional regulator [Rubrobacteraceae bacterium]
MDKDNGIQAFAEGDIVVYPNHGAGCVSGIEEKTVLGEERRYYVIYIKDTGLTLSIPANGDSGLRYCANEAGVAGALSVLGSGAVEMPANWNHRLKHNQKKLREGDITQVAEVVRDLSAYSKDHGLSTGERNMLMKARQILASEIALVRETNAREAETLVDGALAGGGEEA